MQPHHLSRRHFFAALLVLLFGWLGPSKSSRAAPRRKLSLAKPSPLAYRWPEGSNTITTHTYDARGRCLRSQEHSPCPTQVEAFPSETLGDVTSYSYTKEQ